MPNAAQMARLCVLVGHLNQFKLTEGRMHGGDDLTTEPHTTPKTSTYEDSEPITDVVTRIIGFVLLEASVETGLFKKTLHECERRLVQGIEVLQPHTRRKAFCDQIRPQAPFFRLRATFGQSVAQGPVHSRL